MIQEAKVRRGLDAVANGELSLRAFEEWLESASWSMHSDSAPAAVELVSLIHALMSERDEGMIGRDGYVRELLALRRRSAVRVRFSSWEPLAADPIVATAARSNPFRRSLPWPA